MKEYIKKKEKGLLTTQQLVSYTEKVHSRPYTKKDIGIFEGKDSN